MNINDANYSFTILEQRFLLGYGLPPEVIPNPQGVRRLMKGVAFQEAAHVAADAFTGVWAGNILRVSILPDVVALGRRTRRGIPEERFLGGLPSPIKKSRGCRLLLYHLAGRAARLRVLGKKYFRSILEPDSAEWLNGEIDLQRANALATIMSHPGLSAKRILELAAKWTNEMLDLPAVWDAVKSLAQALLERGTVDDPIHLNARTSGILYLSLELPRWRRRFGLDQKTSAQVIKAFYEESIKGN
jgi:hypothetical protein